MYLENVEAVRKVVEQLVDNERRSVGTLVTFQVEAVHPQTESACFARVAHVFVVHLRKEITLERFL
jgi:hypothetical protein